MLRLALTPRWLLGLLVLLGLVVLAVNLGRWQWDRTQTILAAERAAVAEPVDVRQALGDATDEVPAEGIGRPVTASGTYVADRQAIVANRSLDGRPGVWVVTGLTLDDGAVVPVLRGWLPDADAPGAAVPVEPVSITGILQPDEVFYAGATAQEGTIAAISRDRLAQLWQVPVRPGFVVLQSTDPSTPPAPDPVPPTVQTADVPFPLQNFFYAVQWWIFAAFGLVFYLRWLWIEAGRQPEDTEPIAN
jgi:cytochrome oxidase assembly protein ShyY1